MRLHSGSSCTIEQLPECTGLSANWCPACGDCTCPFDADDYSTRVERESESCPLHGRASVHGPDISDARTRANGE